MRLIQSKRIQEEIRRSSHKKWWKNSSLTTQTEPSLFLVLRVSSAMKQSTVSSSSWSGSSRSSLQPKAAKQGLNPQTLVRNLESEILSLSLLSELCFVIRRLENKKKNGAGGEGRENLGRRMNRLWDREGGGESETWGKWIG